MKYDWGLTFEHGLAFEQILADEKLVQIVKAMKHDLSKNWHYTLLKALYDHYKAEDSVKD
jgi:hypothetical protein